LVVCLWSFAENPAERATADDPFWLTITYNLPEEVLEGLLEDRMSSSFRDLRVWQESMKFARAIHKSTVSFPRHELYGLSSQMRRAAVSVPSNIAEGKGHRSDKEFSHFLYHARGSLLELQTQLLIAEDLQYISQEDGRRLFPWVKALVGL
jgi:four helix bundle protein